MNGEIAAILGGCVEDSTQPAGYFEVVPVHSNTIVWGRGQENFEHYVKFLNVLYKKFYNEATRVLTTRAFAQPYHDLALN